MFDDGTPIFSQLAESISDDILRGTYAEGDQVPSINELAAYHRINPATANRAVAGLVDQGVLVKRRGIGMFVADGARELIAADRRSQLADKHIRPLITEARSLGISLESLLELIRKEASE